ncbi:MAG: SHOCT domain-containing protein [Candidatus Rokubacteria bacterium]|nr:SHOCT domain-containing protein [Candidatus Rokubacteria bacterium]
MAGMMIVSWLLGLGLVVLLLVGVAAAIRWLWRSPGAAAEDRALAILRERYARGEINREEFESRLRDLKPR